MAWTAESLNVGSTIYKFASDQMLFALDQNRYRGQKPEIFRITSAYSQCAKVFNTRLHVHF